MQPRCQSHNPLKHPCRTSLGPLATRLAITCCTRCRIMTYMTIKEHAICILALRLMFIAWCCSLRARKIALGLLALQLQSAPAAERLVRLLLLLVLLDWWLSSEASASAHTQWPELQRYRGHSNTRHTAAPPAADCTIIYAAALHTFPLCSCVSNCWGHRGRDIKTLCLDSRCSGHFIVIFCIYTMCVYCLLCDCVSLYTLVICVTLLNSGRITTTRKIIIRSCHVRGDDSACTTWRLLYWVSAHHVLQQTNIQ